MRRQTSPGAAAVICLMGPTAVGKTELSLKLCRRLPCEIISVDSAMVYRGLDIGTAKPSKDILHQFRHRLIDICEPDECYSAGRFRLEALAEIQEIRRRGRIPLLVGGTGLYFRALTQGLNPLPDACPPLRRWLNREAAEQGWPALHARLRQVDPEAAHRIHPNDSQRIQRALEVWELSGRCLSELCRAPRPQPPFRPLRIALVPASRELLRRRIEQRFRNMLRQGLLHEVWSLRRLRNATADLPVLRLVGYRQCWSYLQGKISYSVLISSAVAATQQLAKRQLTWLRTELGMRWIREDDPQLLDSVLEHLCTEPGLLPGSRNLV